jgi:hypothetical protein
MNHGGMLVYSHRYPKYSRLTLPWILVKKGSTGPQNLRVVVELGGRSCLKEFQNCELGLLVNLKQHARLSEACLVEATSDNNLSVERNSMSN